MFKLLTITIWLLTCAPGDEIYAHYGHTAIRVQDTEEQFDYCFNYGTFSFDTNNFYWKFVKGETYYILSACPTSWFMHEYAYEHRTVWAQELNLREEEKQAVKAALIENYQPQNAEYLYNFVYDNCATRPFRLLQNVLQDSLTSSYVGWTGHSYREALQHYTRPHTVINGLINMIFGARADQIMTQEDALFLPEQLMFHMQYAQRADGSPLVMPSTEIASFSIAPTRWWECSYLYIALFALLMLMLSLWDRKRKHISWGVDVLLGFIYLLVVLIVIFLRYFSIHPLVGWDWRLIILPLIHLCTRLVYILR